MKEAAEVLNFGKYSFHCLPHSSFKIRDDFLDHRYSGNIFEAFQYGHIICTFLTGQQSEAQWNLFNFP